MPNPESAASSLLQRCLRVLPLAEFAILTAVSVAALFFQLTLPRRLPSEQAYREVAAVLKQEGRDGDVVLLYPWWTEHARLFIKTLPVVGYLGSDSDPLRGFKRIWLLSQPRLPRSDISQLGRRFGPGRTLVASARNFGNLELLLYRNGLYRPIVFSAVSDYQSARVYLEAADGERADCPFDGKVHRCPGREQLRVAAEWHEVLYQPRRCLWMHPPGGPRRLVAEFPAANSGERLTLAAGIVGEYASRRQPELTPTRIAVEETATGRRLLELQIPPGVEGMQQVERRGAPELPSTIGLRISVQSDNAALREACVELFSDRAATQ